MSVPDILIPKPLERAVDVTVETNILEPVSHQYDVRTGGVTRFVLPAKGVLDAPNCTINFELVNGDALTAGTDQNTIYPIWAGGLGCFKKITCRVGGQILSQINEAGMYATMKTGFNSVDYKANVLDVRHSSSNQSLTKVLNDNPNGDPGFVNAVTARGYSQMSNPTLDQQNIYGCQAEGVQANVLHVPQTNKLIRDFANRGRGPEVAIRLADLFPYFESNMLPLLGMAQVELEIHWNSSVTDATTLANITNNIVAPANPVAAGGSDAYSATFAKPPVLSMDYLHYPDQERQQIMDSIANGLTMNFREVVFTQGINAAGTGTVTSNHLLGMAGKEVQNIYVVKRPDLNTTPDQQINSQIYNRNNLTCQFKSQQSKDESYNCFINNQKIYNRDVNNASLQYNYLTQCENKWHCAPLEYDCMNYDADLNMVLNNSSPLGVPNLAVDTNGISGRFLPGSKHVLGIPLMKYSSLGNAPGNGERIGSAPIEFVYSNTKTGGENDMSTNLLFFIEYRRSMVITPLGVTVSDQ